MKFAYECGFMLMRESPSDTESSVMSLYSKKTKFNDFKAELWLRTFLKHCSSLAPGGVAETPSVSEAEASFCVCVSERKGKC